MRSLVKYVGGKTKLSKELGLLLPRVCTSYYEPFCGGSAVFAYLYTEGRIKKAHLSDLNKALIDLYLAVQSDPDSLVKDITSIRDAYMVCDATSAEAMFYRVRSEWNTGIQTPDRYVFLKQTAFNGLWRENAKGHVNMPWGKYGHHGNGPPKILDADSIAHWHKALQVAEVRYVSAFDVHPEPGSVVYLDPPYIGTFAGYLSGGFSDETSKELLRKAEGMTKAGCHVVMSNSKDITQYVRSLWPSSYIKTLKTTYSINRDSSNRKGQEEVAIVGRKQQVKGQSNLRFSTSQMPLFVSGAIDER